MTATVLQVTDDYNEVLPKGSRPLVPLQNGEHRAWLVEALPTERDILGWLRESQPILRTVEFSRVERQADGWLGPEWRGRRRKLYAAVGIYTESIVARDVDDIRASVRRMAAVVAAHYAVAIEAAPGTVVVETTSGMPLAPVEAGGMRLYIDDVCDQVIGLYVSYYALVSREDLAARE